VPRKGAALDARRRRRFTPAVAETIVLRASLPAAELAARFLDAIARGADVDLVVEGRRTRLLPRVARHIAEGGRAGAAVLALTPLFPKVVAILLQCRRLGRTCTVRRVAGAREVVVEIRGARS